jgi:hypothetical protein
MQIDLAQHAFERDTNTQESLTEGSIENALRQKHQEGCRAFDPVSHSILGEISRPVVVPMGARYEI